MVVVHGAALPGRASRWRWWRPLADGDVDAAHLLLGSPVSQALALRDGSRRRRGVLSVIDDQLTLATARSGSVASMALIPVCSGSLTPWRWNHGRGLQLEGTTGLGGDLTPAVDGPPERVDDAAEELVADGTESTSPVRLTCWPFDLSNSPRDDRTNVVLSRSEATPNAAGELEELLSS